jgi:hypothetical protein
MEYRANAKYNFDDQNESRADQTERVLAIGTDRNGECDADTRGVFTDVSDLLANLRHFCDRAGIDYGEVDGHATGGARSSSSSQRASPSSGAATATRTAARSPTSRARSRARCRMAP